jgi:hypothetical protein
VRGVNRLYTGKGDRDFGTPRGLCIWIVYGIRKWLLDEEVGSQGLGGIWIPVVQKLFSLGQNVR